MQRIARSWGAPVAIIAVAASLVLAIGIEGSWFDKHEGAAAWVQAVGTIAAVIATAWIANANFGEERRRTRESERHLWQAVAELSERCIECLTGVLKATQTVRVPDDAFRGAYAPTDLEAPMDGLAAVPLHQLGNVEMVRAVVALRRVMGRVRTELDGFYKSVTTASVSRGLNREALGNYKTEVFNAHASITRLTYRYEAEVRLRRFT